MLPGGSDSAMKKAEYTASILPKNPREWKKWKEERKTLKRKWKEEKLLKELEKKKLKQEEEVKEKEESTELDEKEDCHDQVHMEKNAKGRHYTVSMALPGSILDNAQSPELRTYLAGQIARAAVIYNVDEIIIFNEGEASTGTTAGEFKGAGKRGNGCVQMARILQYLECPQYLRKTYFPQHSDLKYAGLLNPLDCPHHMREDEVCTYREGVVLQKPAKPGKGSFVDVGWRGVDCQVDKLLQPGVRVTVKIKPYTDDSKKRKGQVVAPSTPRTEEGLYWGYSVRLADSLSGVITKCPYKGGYDLTIGTSERGENIDSFTLPSFKHMLVVFGGLRGLEASLEEDQNLNMEDPSLLFQHYLNMCPSQGSRTIRTEEAVLICLSSLRPKMIEAQK